MNLAQLISRVRLQINDVTPYRFTDTLIKSILNEKLREMARKTLLLQGEDSNLVYSSSNDGFALPSDFIKVIYVEYQSSNKLYKRLSPGSIEQIKQKRNDFANIEFASGNEPDPSWYAVYNGYLILDSTTQISPNLYYYKYDNALVNDSDEPSFNEEYHRYLIDGAVMELAKSDGDMTKYQISLNEWELGLNEMLKSKPKSENYRARYVGL